MPRTDDELAARDPRVYFAAERTLLAWVRTGLAMMGFGFVVARFGLFLRAVAPHDVGTAAHHGVSRWVGVSLVALGAAVNVCAAVVHRNVLARLDRGEPTRSRGPSLGITLAFLLALLGLVLAAYLVWGEAAG